jgi:glucokinase
MSAYAIGVDLGGTNLRIAAVDEQGQLLEKATLGTKVARGRDYVIDQMTDSIQRMAAQIGQQSALAGIGIGVPGIIDLETGMLRESPNLPGWSEYPVRAEIERRLNTTVILENDANAAALGEKWLGAARDLDDMCMLTLGTGVGGGLVLGGCIFHGMTGMAGEFGHLTVYPDGHPCKCGNRGCVEQYASATAIVRMAREAIATGAAAQLARAAESDPEFSARIIYNLAIQGDEPSRAIFRRVGEALGIVLADIVNGLNLPMYVVGGGVSSAWEAFAPSIFAILPQRSMVYAATAPPERTSDAAGAAGEVQPRAVARRTIVTRALLGSDAGLYGAARLPLMTRERTRRS